MKHTINYSMKHTIPKALEIAALMTTFTSSWTFFNTYTGAHKLRI